MCKLRILLLLYFLITITAFAQKEANIWYFGYNAGLDFNSGIPVILTDGQLSTNEGCASISDNNGNLLFYTDGITVYSKNHTIMQNGTGLKGNSSSTHSAIIVPKPESAYIYYIFTLDALFLYGGGVNGLQFSEVNMSLNGGLGVVTSKNNLLLTPSNEKVAAVKKPNSNEYWVVAHKYDTYEFVTFDVTALGVNTTPIISNTGFVRSYRTTGQIKISPDGSKLAASWNGNSVEVFNFNINTGRVGSRIAEMNPPGNPYGVEFSPNSNLIYTSYTSYNNRGVSQYNLLAGSSVDIYNSGVEVQTSTYGVYSSLQLGPDGKIYVAKSDGFYIDFIDNPNSLGLGCGYNYEAIYLDGRRSGLGLPTFVSTFFYVEGIVFENTCFMDSTKFSLNDTVDSVVWDFGDPTTGANNTSTDVEPVHVFSGSGNFQVSVSVTVGGVTAVESKTVTIFELPNTAPIVELKQCDEDLDGFFSAFNLNEVIRKITTNSANEIVTFHESQTDAENGDAPILNTTTYKNQIASSDIIWARVENGNGCFSTSQVNLRVTTTQIPNTFIRDFYMCDDDADGVSSFDFSSVQKEIETMFPLGQDLIIDYYRNETDALAEEHKINDITNYKNIGYPNAQQIYVRVDSKIDNDCLGLGAHINLYVEQKPMANPVTIERQCDDDQDGKFPFDSSQLETTLLNGQSLANVTVTYFDENSNLLPSPLPNPFLTATQNIKVRVTNNNVADGNCYNETVIGFVVDHQPIANPVPNQIACDDGIDDVDGLHDFDTTLIESTILNGQTDMEVYYYGRSGKALPSPLPNPFVSNTQTIKVEVVNPRNINCSVLTYIDFIVNPLPQFTIETPQIVCSSDPTFTLVLDPIEDNTMEVYSYEWLFEDGTILSDTPTLTVSTPGIYSITLTKTDGTSCSRTRDIIVNASELAQITLDDIDIVDVSNNNTLSIITNNLGQGEYEFALDNQYSTYQDKPSFSNVSSGIHTLYIRDKKGCGISSIDISVIGFPKYFTPNGDGFNDYWKIDGINGQFQASSNIFIYDRYGKLLKQLSPSSKGWDGTFNGAMLLNDDYWFSVVLEDGRMFKGHFALKR